MNNEFFSIEKTQFEGREAYAVRGSEKYSLTDTLECGQCFRHELVRREGGYSEYIIPIGRSLVRVGERKRGELLFFDTDEKEVRALLIPYFTLDVDYGKIKADVLSHTDSEWMMRAAEAAEGIAILRQDPWEALFSFIVSQNNNIPRIRKIIRELSAAYGVNITLQKGVKTCPANKIDGTPCDEKCRACGICYTFPRATDVAEHPERMLPSHPGFRYKYLLDAAEKVTRGEVDLQKIASAASYEYTVEALTEIKGVGLKVASCTALFGFSNLEAFPIDVWMRRAIDTYFGGDLDPKTLGKYAGVAQQYIFHYIRNLSP